MNSYLAKIQAVDSDQGRFNLGRETVDHFLFRCPRWSNLRHELKRLAANRWDDLAYMLEGWSNERKDGPLDKWAPSKAAISATINFPIATGRLEVRSNEYDEETEDESNRGEGEEDIGTITPKVLSVTILTLVDCAAAETVVTFRKEDL